MNGNKKTAPNGIKFGLFRKAGKIKLKIIKEEKVIRVPYKMERSWLFTAAVEWMNFRISRIIAVITKPTATNPNNIIPGPLVTLVAPPFVEKSATWWNTSGVRVSSAVKAVIGTMPNLYHLGKVKFSPGNT